MNSSPTKLQEFIVRDELSLQNTTSIEVDLHFEDGSKRWCCFINSDALEKFGDWIDGTETIIHIGSPHCFIIVAEITYELIERVLLQLEKSGTLMRHSMSFTNTPGFLD